MGNNSYSDMSPFMAWTLHDLNTSYGISSLSAILLEMKLPEHEFERTHSNKQLETHKRLAARMESVKEIRKWSEMRLKE